MHKYLELDKNCLQDKIRSILSEDKGWEIFTNSFKKEIFTGYSFSLILEADFCLNFRLNLNFVYKRRDDSKILFTL